MPLTHGFKSTVETDAHSIKTNESTLNATYETAAYLPRKSNLVHRLLKMFCIKWPKVSQGGSQIDPNPSAWPSPWILPVHVVSNQQDKDGHQITKLAKCTIDTGNMQGNVVSRDFVENVLEFPFTSFETLTGEEEKGGASITGDLHTPLGAVHLTWYHSSSTRVFRNMRFLISASSHCDMIIGAQSIQREKILSVPCLMAGQNLGFVREDVNTDALNAIQRSVEATHDKKEDTLLENDPLLAKLKKEIEVVKSIVKLHKLGPTKLGDSLDVEKRLWHDIKSDYPEICYNLRQVLTPMLLRLRDTLKYGEGDKSHWDVKGRPGEWDDEIDYAQTLKPSK
ncbi:hypothetical protein BKA65DRAFT_177965 [Rhexocercosporidium sp. MPI-PUGE-AT-0058]|nr:hypothetical protein BKA65DRAFT_177965 [Rhexocercosporidium sp. MPI-PUGE-AT-0058]